MWSVGLKAELGWLSPGSESAPASYSAETWVWTLELQVEDGLNHPRAVGWDLSCPGGKKNVTVVSTACGLCSCPA